MMLAAFRPQIIQIDLEDWKSKQKYSLRVFECMKRCRGFDSVCSKLKVRFGSGTRRHE